MRELPLPHGLLAVLTLVAGLGFVGSTSVVAAPGLSTTPPAQVGSDRTADDVGNAMCPVTPEEPVDQAIFLDHEGRRIFFCCRRCRNRFEADPETYLANLPMVASTALQDSAHAEPEHDGSGIPEQAHDHGAHGSVDHFDVVGYIGRFHILVVHFPIALTATAAFFALLGTLRRSEPLRSTVRSLIWLGAASAVIAAILGLANATSSEYSGQLAWVFAWHRALGIAASALTLATAVLVEWGHRRRSRVSERVATASIVALATLVGVAAHFGGSLVYGWDYLLP